MSRISKSTKEKIETNVLRILFDESPRSMSATAIAEIEARDKQFILKILRNLETRKLVRNVAKTFARKNFWVMTDKAYMKYRELL
jgi:DNA-binding transcriptional regulator GbsR (MarR family)